MNITTQPKKILSLIILLIIFASLIATNNVLANNTIIENLDAVAQRAGLTQQDDIRVVIAGIIGVIFGFLGIIMVVFIIYGGWLWMTSAGDSAKVDKAKKLIINAIIGIVIVIASWSIASYIINKAISATGGGQ